MFGVHRTGQSERGRGGEIVALQMMRKAAMDCVHGLHVGGRLVEQPIDVYTVAAAYDTRRWDRERVNAWQHNLWRLVDVRNQCGDFNERFHVAALPTS